jgi:hypothetical protein
VSAESVYLFRLASATLYEGARAFQDIERELKATGFFQEVNQLDHTGRDAFSKLENAFRQGFEKTDFGKVLVQFRHHVFRYDKPESFSEALNGHEEGHVLIRDHHDPYLSWERFEKIPRQIALNRRAQPGPGAPREGRSVLQGVILCGAWGRRREPDDRAGFRLDTSRSDERFSVARALRQRAPCSSVT